jgi:hypothetical protein
VHVCGLTRGTPNSLTMQGMGGIAALVVVVVVAAAAWEVEAATPRWTPTYNMSESTVVMPCNYSGLYDFDAYPVSVSSWEL